MTKLSLKHLSLDELYELMVLMIDDYTVMQQHLHNSDAAELKKGEIHLIQTAIDELKSKLSPTH